MKKKYLITNVVYGPLYSKIFLEQHLRSVLDETNLPAISGRYDITYQVYTDQASKAAIEAHANFKRLSATVTAKITAFDWTRDDKVQFDMRYSVLMQVFQDSLKTALEEKVSYLTAWVADLVVARDYFPKIMNRMDQGHGAVFVLPLRSAFEPMAHHLNQTNRALPAYELFALGFHNLHPLWVACEWVNKRFTRLPFSFLWSTPSGIMARSFSVTPVVFRPKQIMLDGRGMIDGEVPALCDNPYWCEDWTEAPVIGVEPLFCYYPTWSPKRVNIKAWSRKSIHPSQFALLKKRLYYPDKKTARLGIMQRLRSDAVVRGLSL